jgi:hypothetical protein
MRNTINDTLKDAKMRFEESISGLNSAFNTLSALFKKKVVKIKVKIAENFASTALRLDKV